MNADMVEGMIVAAQQWEQELLMFDNEVTQELAEGMVVGLGGADCNNSEQLHSNTNHGSPSPLSSRVRPCNPGNTMATLPTLTEALEPARGEVVELGGAALAQSALRPHRPCRQILRPPHSVHWLRDHL